MSKMVGNLILEQLADLVVFRVEGRTCDRVFSEVDKQIYIEQEVALMIRAIDKLIDQEN
jgi:hypothetical protein